IKAGALIPAALLTAVDTSRPGPVVAVTTEPVFDSVTGRILLVPQGTRLLGNQGGDSAHGERRAYITWSRMILPDGRSLLLDGEAAADGAGAAGVPGRPDRRLLQLTGAALLSGAVSTLGEIARGGRGGRRGSVADAVSDAIAGQAVELGGRVLDRELDIKPRIVVGAGAPVAVLITKDLILEPVP
ncbi:TrbI/VirB10 family protein, partial [Phenylobacterium sp.]|uniref:TrbI/VirB10 family protein n=1 Tax=Phenylobacterium sp. TaxID=1871053 RepID=UPI002E2F9707